MPAPSRPHRRMRLQKTQNRVSTRVAHSPFDDHPYPDGFMVHSTCGNKHLFFQLRFIDEDDVHRLPRLLRGDTVSVVFPDHWPHHAIVIASDFRVWMLIVAIMFSEEPQPM